MPSAASILILQGDAEATLLADAQIAAQAMVPDAELA